MQHAKDLRVWWNRRGPAVMAVAIAVMSALAVLKLGGEFNRLIFSTADNGALDLGLRYDEVDRWFAGQPVYTALHRLTYLPETYALLWPFVGWLEFGAARWLWAVTSILALIWMAVLILRESGADTRQEQTFVVMMWLSMNAVGVTVGNGQLIVHMLPALVAALLLLRDPRKSWVTDIGAAAMMLVALMKPTISLPFVWVAVVAARRIRPFVLTGVAYALLTLIAARFQPAPLLTLAGQWWEQTRVGGLGEGYGDLHTGLAAFQLQRWNAPTSLALVIALGIWTYRRRNTDLWILLGVAALVARFWTYHRVYDDSLIVLPLVALFRIVKRGPARDGTDVIAAAMLAVGIVAMLAPARMELAPPPVNWVFIGGHVLVWSMMLFFLIHVAQAESQAGEERCLRQRSPLDRPH